MIEKYQLSAEELAQEEEIISLLDSGEFKSVPNLEEEMSIAQTAARNYFKDKESRVINNIDIKVQDFTKIKKLATKREMSFCDLVSEILHDYATGHLKKAG